MIYKAVEDAEDRQEQGVPDIAAAEVGSHVSAARLHATKSKGQMALEVP